MVLIVMMLLKLAFVIMFIAFLNLIAKGMFALSGMLFKVGEAAFDSSSTENDIVKIPYPLHQEKTINGSQQVARRGSSFFEDAGGLDLEYRGVGVAQDRRAKSVFGATVPKGATRGNRRSR